VSVADPGTSPAGQTGLPPSRNLAVGVDIGGTKIAAGLVDEVGNLLRRSARATPSSDTRAIAATVVELVDEVAGGRPIGWIGVGAAGCVDAEAGVVHFAPHLAWRGEPLRDVLSDRIGRPVLVDNDANGAAWAEYRFGAGRGHHDMVMVTVGTGIGGGIIAGGRVYRGGLGMAGEFGHLVLVRGGRACACGRSGCWEAYCSGPALIREAATLMTWETGLPSLLASLADGDPARVTGPMVTKAADAGCPTALAAYRSVGTALGEGLITLTAVLDPSLVVIGGGAGAGARHLLAPARLAYREGVSGAAYRPVATIVAAHFGPEAGIVGVADRARLAGSVHG